MLDWRVGGVGVWAGEGAGAAEDVRNEKKWTGGLDVVVNLDGLGEDDTASARRAAAWRGRWVGGGGGGWAAQCLVRRQGCFVARSYR